KRAAAGARRSGQAGGCAGGRSAGSRRGGRRPEGGEPVPPAAPRGGRRTTSAAAATEPLSRPRRHAAGLVAAGIFLSRLAGLVRQRVLAHFLGLTDAADAFAAAFRIPNFLQNLFGEGVLSASFIPVYARLQAQGRQREARQVAAAVAGFLALV